MKFFMLLFIDTTEYRRFLSSEPDNDLLETLKKILQKKYPFTKADIRLITTDQIVDEYDRSENERVKTSRSHHEKKELSIKFDRLAKTESAEEIAIDKKAKALQTSFDQLRDKKIENFDKNIDKTKQLIHELFDLSLKVNCTETFFRKAEMRCARGMHPQSSGNGSIGDGINWEILLSQPDEDLTIITADRDFVGDDNVLHYTMKKEWQLNHRKKISTHQFLGDFIAILKKDLKISTKNKKTSRKTKNGKEDKQESSPSTGTSQYVFRSKPVTDNEQSVYLSLNDQLVNVKSVWDDQLSLYPSLSLDDNNLKCCPFCQADKSLIQKHTDYMSFTMKKSYHCNNCGKKFSID